MIRLRNSQKVNKACDVSLISKGVQEHGMKILYILYVTAVDVMLDYEIKYAETLL